MFRRITKQQLVLSIPMPVDTRAMRGRLTGLTSRERGNLSTGVSFGQIPT